MLIYPVLIQNCCQGYAIGGDPRYLLELVATTNLKEILKQFLKYGLGFTTYNIFPHWNATKEDIKKKALEHNETTTPLNDGDFIEIEYK